MTTLIINAVPLSLLVCGALFVAFTTITKIFNRR
jgi:hypothetical protein